jgi:stage III sporulation protein AH
MKNAARNTRRATAITLAAALAIAVYLNWQYANTDLSIETDSLTTTASTDAEDAVDVSGTVTDELMTEAEAASSANKNYGEAQLVSVANSTGNEFFEQARLSRQKAHDEALETIQKSLKGSSLSSEEKAVYTAQLAQNLENINAENEIETLILAKGFADCLCFLQNGQANLTVMTSGEALTAAQVAQIRDIVLSKCDVTAQNITVVEVK